MSQKAGKSEKICSLHNDSFVFSLSLIKGAYQNWLFPASGYLYQMSELRSNVRTEGVGNRHGTGASALICRLFRLIPSLFLPALLHMPLRLLIDIVRLLVAGAVIVMIAPPRNLLRFMIHLILLTRCPHRSAAARPRKMWCPLPRRLPLRLP